MQASLWLANLVLAAPTLARLPNPSRLAALEELQEMEMNFSRKRRLQHEQIAVDSMIRFR